MSTRIEFLWDSVYVNLHVSTILPRFLLLKRYINGLARAGTDHPRTPNKGPKGGKMALSRCKKALKGLYWQ